LALSEGKGKILSIYIGESYKYKRNPLYKEIVMLAKKEGLAGATVIRGIEGFGANSKLRSADILRLSFDLPVIVKIVDREEKIMKILPKIKEMVNAGLITIEDVDIIKYSPDGIKE